MAPSPPEMSGPMRFSQISSPVLALRAWTMLPVLARNMTPLWTMGVGSLAPPSFMAQVQTSCRSFTLVAFTCVSGLWLQAW